MLAMHFDLGLHIIKLFRNAGQLPHVTLFVAATHSHLDRLRFQTYLPHFHCLLIGFGLKTFGLIIIM